MSGPKVDEAELERRKQEELEKKRQERLRIIREAMGRYHKCVKYVMQVENNILNDRINDIKKYGVYEEIKGVVDSINQYKTNIVSIMQSILDATIPAEAKDIDALVKNIYRRIDDTAKKYEKESAGMWNRVEVFKAGLDKERDYSDFSKKISSESETIYDEIDLSFVLDIIDENHCVEKEFGEEVKSIVTEITDMIADEAVIEDDYNTLMSFLKKILDVKVLDNNKIKSLLDNYRIARVGINQRRKAFEAEYREYIASYVECLDSINALRKSPIDIKPKSMTMFCDLDEIKKELIIIDRVSRINNERNYIRSQLDEIMEGLEYNLCEDIVFNSNQINQHYLCRSKKGNNAIHISISDSKQIMMEMVSTEMEVNNGNREINAELIDERGLTEDEISSQIEEQGQFCKIHPNIVAECKKRGIILNPKMHQKIDRTFAKKIRCFNSETGQEHWESDVQHIVNYGRVSKRRINRIVNKTCIILLLLSLILRLIL